MKSSSASIEKAVEAFASLPSIGRKTAQRLTFHLLKKSDDEVIALANAFVELKQNVKLCSNCYNYTDVQPCPICSSHKRLANVICVVEEPADVMAIEKTNGFFGKYHVLHGVLNPLEGIHPNDLKIRELLQRLAEVEEVILALNPNVEGEVTTQYLAKLLSPLNIKVSRIASGVPLGSSLEFSDEATLSRAIENRISL